MRIFQLLIPMGLCLLLLGCTEQPYLDKGEPQPGPLQVDAPDVAWATGWHILKLECPSTDFNGMQVVVLDQNGNVLSGGGSTIAINHSPGMASLLRVAFRIDGKDVKGRMSANNISVQIEHPDAFLVRHMVIHHEPKFENDMYILAEEYTGKSAFTPVARQLALRLVNDLY